MSNVMKARTRKFRIMFFGACVASVVYFGISAANAATLICTGLGLEFDDAACDANEIEAALGLAAGNLAGLSHQDAYAKDDDTPALFASVTPNTSGVGGTVSWTTAADVQQPSFWVEKFDGLYNVFDFGGTGSNALGWSDSAIREISNNITCAQRGTPNCGADTSHVALFAAVPIPPALLLFGSGLIGLAAVARRKRSSSASSSLMPAPGA